MPGRDRVPEERSAMSYFYRLASWMDSCEWGYCLRELACFLIVIAMIVAMGVIFGIGFGIGVSFFGR